MIYSDFYNVYIFDSDDELTDYITTNISEINDYIFDKIKNSLNLPYFEDIILFYVKTDDMEFNNVELSYTDFMNPLKKCLDRFEESEQYEKCQECLELIKKINI